MSHEDYSWMVLPNTDLAWHVGFEKFIEHTFEGTYVHVACVEAWHTCPEKKLKNTCFIEGWIMIS